MSLASPAFLDTAPQSRATRLGLVAWLRVVGGSPLPHEPADLERFYAFLRPLRALALLLAGTYAAAAAVTQSAKFATVAVLLVVYWVATLFARRLADRGRLSFAAGIISYGVLAFVIVGEILRPSAYPALMVAGLLAVAMALPYIDGRSLRVLLAASLPVIVLVGVRGFTAQSELALPPWVRFVSEEGGAWAAAYLVLLLLWQSTERLRQTLEQTRRAHRAAEDSRERAAFLSEASRVLGASSLDYRATLAAVAHLAVPRLADYCIIDELETDGRLQRVEGAHAEPGKQDLLDRLRALDVTTAAHPSKQVMITLKPLLIQQVDDARLQAVAQTEEHLMVLRELRPRSAMVLPLVARDRALGSILLARTTPRPFSTDDLELAKDLANRAALATDNARLYAEAQAAVRTRDEFLSIASHELKTPLTPLDLQIQVLRRHAAEIAGGSMTAEWIQKRLDTLARQSDRLGRLVNELLDISRIANGRLLLTLESVDLAELVCDVKERFFAGREGATSSSQIGVHVPSGIVGQWDRMRLDQVITNLLSNALKYGASKPIEIAATGEGKIVVISVTDQGIGIAKEDQERIFERFERAVPSANFGGLGMGLFITRQLLGAMGGEIGVRSELGHGATFVVRLPLEAQVPDPGDGGRQ
jgi:signal transduction histidine kinase